MRWSVRAKFDAESAGLNSENARDLPTRANGQPIDLDEAFGAEMLNNLFLRPPQRHLQAERMDQPDLEIGEHHSALKSLARINWISRSASIVGPPIFFAARERHRGRALRVLDLASGAGDILATLARQAEARDLAIDWTGCDISPIAVAHAQEQAARDRLPITFLQADALSDPLPADSDVVMCSLFLHHLKDHQAVNLMTRMRAAAAECVLINDLIRSRWGYILAQAGCRLLTRSAIVHFDGPVSVAGAYTVDEVRKLASDAGLISATFTQHWPQRFLLNWRRS